MASYVLVVDDEEPIRRLLGRRLHAWGYAAREVASAADALTMMASEPASIAVIDVRMPGENGIWLTEQIRQRWPQTVIIIATGADDLEGVDAMKLGVFGHVLKPFDQVVLREMIDRASQRRSSQSLEGL